MTNAERIQAYNAELREAINIANSLPDAGEGGEDVSEETVEYTAKLEILENTITELEVALRHKESVQPVTETLTVTENGTYRPSEGVDGYSVVNVNVPIPNDYIKPSGMLEVTENGTYDITEYASVDVNVSPGTSETWTFTMEDGTEVVKEVVVV